MNNQIYISWGLKLEEIDELKHKLETVKTPPLRQRSLKRQNSNNLTSIAVKSANRVMSEESSASSNSEIPCHQIPPKIIISDRENTSGSIEDTSPLVIQDSPFKSPKSTVQQRHDSGVEVVFETDSGSSAKRSDKDSTKSNSKVCCI